MLQRLPHNGSALKRVGKPLGPAFFSQCIGSLTVLRVLIGYFDDVGEEG